MKLFTAFLAAFLMCAGFAGPAAAEQPQKPVEEITEPQPLAVGTRFFTKNSTPRGYQAHYTYMGWEGGYLKVKYERYYHYDELEESDIYTLPLDANKKALLCTAPFYGETAASTTKLFINVVDDLGQITVQKAR